MRAPTRSRVLGAATAATIAATGLIAPTAPRRSPAHPTLTALPTMLAGFDSPLSELLLGNPDGYALPSFRMWAENSQLRIADAIGADYPVSSRTRRPGAARVAAQSAAKTAKAGAAQPSTRHTTRAKRSDSGPRAGATVRNSS